MQEQRRTSALGENPRDLLGPPGRSHAFRLNLIVLMLILGFGGLIGRLFVLQVLHHEKMARRAERNTRSYEPRWGKRGDLLTQDRTILAREVIEYIVALDPKLISPANLQPAFDLVCKGLGLVEQERRNIQARFQDRLEKAARGEGPEPRFVVLRRGVAAGLVGELAGAVEQLLPREERRGVIFQPIHFRQYPRGSFLGSVVGVTVPGIGGDDLEGVEGLEKVLHESLLGRDGTRMLMVEGRRKDRWYSPGEVDVHPVDGYNAILTIDSHFQGIAEEELERGLERERAAAGTVIIMDCRNGDIQAMVNLPSLDPNHYHDYPPAELEERRKNRAIESMYEPGSTIKPFTAAVAYEKRLFGLNEMVWGGGRMAHFGSRLVQDVSNHGPITFSQAVILSSNIGMTHVGLRLGRDGLIDVLDRFHFQRKTGIPLPGEAVGKRTARNRWSENFTTVSVSFGYEVMMTPIQLCAGYASLVNGGRLYRPRLVDRLEREGETVPFPVEEVGRPIREETSRIIRDILVRVVEEGTAKALRIPGFTYGGKTGTRRSKGKNGDLYGDCLSSFIAFAPAEDPQYVVLVMIERPKEHTYGSTVAGPVVTGILKRIFRIEDLASGPPAR